MKTMKRENENGKSKYTRVPDSNARDRDAIREKLKDGWEFCPKGEWKRDVRDGSDK